ncbi:MAG: hypothetical protein SGJ24_05795 [Chloroflexota bacterium]|nr:hypothetical protein [Chloroflexota bacterium]
MSANTIFEAQAAHEESLLAKRNVVGVAVGYKNAQDEANGEVAIVVLVEQKLPIAALTVDDLVPRQIEGVRTDVIEIGYLRANQVPLTARDRHRPTIPAGVSIGHYKVTAGTLGAIVKDRASGQRLILSNNHVLANSNDAMPTDPILQPGPMDGGKQPGDTVAILERFIALKYIGDTVTPNPIQPPKPEPVPSPNPQPGGGNVLVAIVVGLVNLILRLLGSKQQVASIATPAAAFSASSAAAPAMPIVPIMPEAQAAPENRVDGAVARPINAAAFSDAIQNIGAITGTKGVTLGMRVRKYGRTTDYTEGKVTLINATVNVGYSTAAGQKSARFVGQVITEPMSKGGDSGSLIVDAEGQNAVGLLFAGSDLATIFTPIDVVLDALNVTF